MRISVRFPIRFRPGLGTTLGLLTGLGLLAAPPSAAQPAGEAERSQTEAVPVEPEATPLAPPPPGSEVIEITGERRASSAQQEAVSITQFSQEALDTFGIQDVSSLQDFVPSLHIGNYGQVAIITLRGVGLENITQIGEQSVLFEVDEIALGRPSAALQAAFFDLETLDVTRGPQGTEGGRGSTGGKISLYSARPKPELEMFGDFQYGTKNQKLTRGVLNVPLADEYLMSRISINHEDRQGYQKNELFGREADADDAENLSLRGQLLGLPADGIEWRLIATYTQQKGVGPGNKVLGPLDTFTENCPDDAGLNACPRRLIKPNGAVINPVDPRISYSDHGAGDPESPNSLFRSLSSPAAPGFQDNNQWGVTPSASVLLPTLPLMGDTRFRVVGGYYANHTEGNFDIDGTNAPIGLVYFKQLSKQKSVDVFLESVEAERVNWKGGIFYYREDVDGGNAGFVGNGPFQNATTSGTESFAGYGQATFFPLDNLELILGIRYTREKKPASEKRGANNPALDVNRNAVWTNWSPRAEFTWRVTDTNHVTVGATRGFKAGGFNLGSLTNAQITACNLQESLGQGTCPELQFNEETVWQYQLLSKNSLFDDTAEANVTLFWTRYQNYQTCQITTLGFLCNSGGQALLRGVEFEARWQPVTGLRVDGNFHYLDTSVNNFRVIDPTKRPGDPLNEFPIDVNGNRLPRSPLFAVNTGIQYEFELGPYGYLTPRAQYRWQDTAYFRIFNGVDKNDPYHWADIKLTWRSEDDRWSLEGSLENVTDVDVVNNIIIGPIGSGAPILAFYRPPRRWSIKAGFRW